MCDTDLPQNSLARQPTCGRLRTESAVIPARAMHSGARVRARAAARRDTLRAAAADGCQGLRGGRRPLSLMRPGLQRIVWQGLPCPTLHNAELKITAGATVAGRVCLPLRCGNQGVRPPQGKLACETQPIRAKFTSMFVRTSTRPQRLAGSVAPLLHRRHGRAHQERMPDMPSSLWIVPSLEITVDSFTVPEERTASPEFALPHKVHEARIHGFSVRATRKPRRPLSARLWIRPL